MNINSADISMIDSENLETTDTKTQTNHLTRNHIQETVYSCSRCLKPTRWQDNPFKPFCSRQCKLIDLSDWADEAYRVPVQDTDY